MSVEWITEGSPLALWEHGMILVGRLCLNAMPETWGFVGDFLTVALTTTTDHADNTFICRQVVAASCILVAWQFLYLTGHAKHCSQNLNFDIY